MSSASIPKAMKAVVVEKNGGIEELKFKTDVPVPEPKDGEVLVKNEFIGMNYIDNYFRTGLYPSPSFPYIPGREGAGTIISVGPSSIPSDLTSSTRVAYMSGATYAEYTAVPVKYCIPVPESITSDIAAAAILQGLTALTLIREAHAVQAGEWILVTAAAGGVGLWLCQLLKIVGARVIAIASTPEKRELAKKYGAEVALEYHEENKDEFVKKVMEITGGEGVTAALDSVGKATFDPVFACIKRKGSMISFGNASGAVEPFSIGRLSAKNIKLMRPQLFGFIATREEAAQYMNELYEFITKKGLEVSIHEIYPLEDVQRATKDFEGRKTTGKLLLKP